MSDSQPKKSDAPATLAKKKKKRAKIHPYLDPGLIQALKTHSGSKRVTESSVVEAALKDYLEGTSDKALLMKRLNRINRAIDRHGRDIQVLTEAFAVFMEFWFAHTPQILGEEAKEEARRVSAARFDAYRDLVAQRLNGTGGRFINDVVEDVADVGELQRAAAAMKGDAA